MSIPLSTALKDLTTLETQQLKTTGVTPLEMADTTWEDLRFPATTVRQGANFKPDFDYTNVGLAFDDSSDETIYVNCQLPHNWNKGVLKPHVHWIKNQNEAVAWKLEWRWQLNGGVQVTDWSSDYLDVELYDYAQNRIMISNGVTITPPEGVMKSDILQMKLSRDVSEDAYSGDAVLIEFDVHYQLETLGTSDEYPPLPSMFY